MNKNPYSVLGVSENATDEEITKAYKDLVKKYHPDKYANSDLAELANEKMSEINVAYDEIQKMRKGGASHAGSSSNEYSGSYSSGNAEYNSIRGLINARRFADAMARLNTIQSADRGAEWNFLYGLSLYGTGRVFDAVGYIEKACNMDPSNMEYRAVKDRLSGAGFNYGNGYGYGNRQGTTTQCSSCDVCQTLICADCCCECLGGDLISCC